MKDDRRKTGMYLVLALLLLALVVIWGERMIRSSFLWTNAFGTFESIR